MNNDPITSFTGEYKWLSNFELATVIYEGLTYKHNEGAFQAAKDLRPEIRQKFTQMTPREAKNAGQRNGIVILRPDWEDIKDQVMYDVNLDKFTRHLHLREKLLATGDRRLTEGNNHGDRIWGTVDGVGQDRLGKILMRIRRELRGN